MDENMEVHQLGHNFFPEQQLQEKCRAEIETRGSPAIG